MGAETYTRKEYLGEKLEYGKYLVIRKDGKIHFEIYMKERKAHSSRSVGGM
jgi:hypothetical protein